MPMHVALIDSLHQVFTQRLTAAGFYLHDFSQLSQQEILPQLAHMHGIALRSKFKITEHIIQAAPHLHFIARAGAGLENINTEYAAQHNIVCFNSPEGNRDSVAEHTIGMLLMLLHKLHIANAEVKKSMWQRQPNWGNELAGKTVAIIGFGNMGSAFAKRLQGFDCHILAYDPYITIDTQAFPYVTQCPMSQVFQQADIVSFHTPLTPTTRHLCNGDYILQFQKPIVVLNTARGAIVDTQSILPYLHNGRVAGACFDVLEYEPVTFEAIDFNSLPSWFVTLQQHPQVVITPHIAGWTTQSNYKIADVLATKIINHFNNA